MAQKSALFPYFLRVFEPFGCLSVRAFVHFYHGFGSAVWFFDFPSVQVSLVNFASDFSKKWRTFLPEKPMILAQFLVFERKISAKNEKS